MAEQDRVLSADRPGGEGSGVEHGQLAADGQQRVEGHDGEHRIGAVVADPAGELAGQRGHDEPLWVSAMARSWPGGSECRLTAPDREAAMW
jgi:hypothetical protein